MPSTQAEVILCVGEAFHKSYQQRWKSMEKRSSKLSWNWATFFFRLFWVVYRKMYGFVRGYIAVIFYHKQKSELLFKISQ